MKSLLKIQTEGSTDISRPFSLVYIHHKKQIKPLLLFSNYFLSSEQYTGHLNNLIVKEYLIIYLCFTAVWNNMDVRMKWLA